MTAALLVVALVLAVVPGAVADEAPAVTPPRLSYLDGEVSFWRPGADSWTPAPPNLALAPGDELYTGHPGNAELQVGPRAFVRAWGDTQFGVAGQTSDLLQLRVTSGHVAVDVRALDAEQVIQVHTPGATFSIDRPGYYRVDTEPERTLFTTRRSGQATLTRVEGGSTQTSAAPAPDVWDRWNQTRTDEVLQSASARYVPDSVYGAHDLDVHGDWRVLPTYGAVWVPRGSPAGWAPYTTGRWLWDPRFGWTWVDAAVWGWAPYHYGRWVYLDGIWAWAPGPIVARPVYAPALVAFFNAPGVRIGVGAPFVSWVALGWGEPVVPWWGRPGFVGRPAWLGWGGPRVVNNVVINKTTIVNATDIRVYRNSRVHRAVVAVAPDRFGRAHVQDARVTDIDMRRLSPVRGPLRVAPDSGNRADSHDRGPRPPDAGRPRPQPAPRAESPSASPVTPVPRVGATPDPVPTPGDDSPRARRREPGPPRNDGPRLEPRRSQATPRLGADARPAERDPRTQAARPQAPGPSRVEPPRVERARPDMPAQVERPRVDPTPQAERPRPEMRPRVERPRPEPGDAAERGLPTRREQLEPHRGAAGARPSLKGAGAHERPERGGTRPGPQGRRG